MGSPGPGIPTRENAGERAALTVRPGLDHGVPPEAHYRPSTDPTGSCGTCSYYGAGTNGRCGMYDTPVEASYTCDEWAVGLRPTPNDPFLDDLAAAMALPLVGTDRCDCDWQPGAPYPACPHDIRGPIGDRGHTGLVAAAVPTVADHNRLIRNGYRRAEALEPKLAAVIEPILRQAGDEAARNFQARATDHLTATAGWTSPAPDEIINVEALVQKLRTKTDPVRLAVVKSIMTPTLDGVGIKFDVTNPLTKKVLAQSGSQVTSIAQTTQLNVMRAIRHAYEQGLSIPDTAKAIRAGMAEASPARARLIARTELVGAVNGGSLAATQIVGDATGTDYFKQWLTAPGASYPRHEDYDGLDGQTVRLDDTFTVGEDELQYPGDPDGSPEEVCNCRCALAYTDDPAELTDGGAGGGMDDAEAGDQTTADDSGVGEGGGSQGPGWAPEEVSSGEADSLAMPLMEKMDMGTASSAETEMGLALSETGLGGVTQVIKDDQGLHGVINYAKRDEALYVTHLGSVAPGGGTALMRAAARAASDQGIGIRLESVDESIGFYEKIGMEREGETNFYHWSPEQARAFAEPALGPVSSDPYVASLQAELVSLDNKIANIDWYVRKGKELPHHSGRRAALEQRQAEVKRLITASDRAAEETELKAALDSARYDLRHEPGDAYLKERVKLMEARQDALSRLATDVKPPVEVPREVYRASLKKERDSTSNKIANLVWKEKNKPTTFTGSDAARLRALRAHKTNMDDLWNGGLNSVAERRVLEEELARAPELGGAEAQHYADLLNARIRTLDELAAPVGETVEVLPGTLQADLAAIRGRAEWLSQPESYRAAREGTATHPASWYQERAAYVPEKYLRPGEVAGVEGYGSGYALAQHEAVMAAGARVEEELAAHVSGANLEALDAREAANAAARENVSKLYREYGDKGVEVGRTEAAVREEVAQEMYGVTFSSLQRWSEEGMRVREAAAKHPRLLAAIKAQEKARSEWVVARDTVDAEATMIRMARGEGGAANLAVQRKNLIDVLSQARGMSDGKLRYVARRPEAGLDPVLEPEKAKALLDQATRFLPTEWVTKMRSAAVSMTRRGYHVDSSGIQRIYVSLRKGSVASDPSGLTVALHELGHEVEDTNYDVRLAERTFYQWRTRGGSFDGPQEPLRKLSDIRRGSGYKDDEKAREDKFSNPYMGKEYGGSNYELLTMGLEALFTDASSALDPEYRQWLLGVLALL